MTEKNKRDIGKEGEDIAVKYLKEKEFIILERNFHYSTKGEIDIVANDKNQLVFIEVKSRINLDYGEPEYAINPKKIKQIKKMAELYLFEKEIEEADCRFDVVAILLGDGSNPVINHYENAFM
jgi:putative endonuclease